MTRSSFCVNRTKVVTKMVTTAAATAVLVAAVTASVESTSTFALMAHAKKHHGGNGQQRHVVGDSRNEEMMIEEEIPHPNDIEAADVAPLPPSIPIPGNEERKGKKHHGSGGHGRPGRTGTGGSLLGDAAAGLVDSVVDGIVSIGKGLMKKGRGGRSASKSSSHSKEKRGRGKHHKRVIDDDEDEVDAGPHDGEDVEAPPPPAANAAPPPPLQHQPAQQKSDTTPGTPPKSALRKEYHVNFERLLQTPILSSAFSTSTFNYNAAYVPHVGSDANDNLPRDCLAVRVQNYTAGVGQSSRSFSSMIAASQRKKKQLLKRSTEGAKASASTNSRFSSLINSHRDNTINEKKHTHEGSDSDDHLIGVGYIGPSSIDIVCENSNEYPFAREGTWTVLKPSQKQYQALGTEDPRVVFIPDSVETEEFLARGGKTGADSSNGDDHQTNSMKSSSSAAKTGSLLMFYTAVNNMTSDGHVTAQLALAICHLSVDPQCRQWELRGPILPQKGWSKSGALMLHPATAAQVKAGVKGKQKGKSTAPNVHYLLYGDTDIFVAATTDFLTYTDLDHTLMAVRSDADGFFDSNLIESGPPPELLSDGESYLFLYNSAREADIPNPDPNWKLQYNLGYAVLGYPTTTAEGSAPRILSRATKPILSPELGWETCNNASRVAGLTADVVFVEGMKRLSGGTKSSNTNAPGIISRDSFLVYYQGADARMGMGIVTVDVELKE